MAATPYYLNLSKYLFCIFLCLTLLQIILAANPPDPYTVLKIPRSASSKEIKQAYKKMVMQWHPDKNNSPEAKEKIMEINRAYEVLSDQNSKENYDRYGSYDSGSSAGYQQQHNFDQFFNYAFTGSGFGGRTSEVFEKYRISTSMYTNTILQRSYTQPFIIYAYSTYCNMCFLLEDVWKDAVGDLEALGYGIGTINYFTDGLLFEKLRIGHLPALAVLVEGRVMHFRGDLNQLNAKSIRMFARDSIPSQFLPRLYSYNGLRRFLDQWESTNKVSILIMGAKEEPRLRYLLASMKYSHFARFAYVNLKDKVHGDIQEMKSALGINCFDCENIYIFKENPEKGPFAKLSTDGRQFSTQEISQHIEKNKVLQLPRISSSLFFDELCPVSSRSQKHFCVILPMQSDASSEIRFSNAMRQFVEENGEKMSAEKIHISTIFVDKQRNFVDEFKGVGASPKSKKRGILVLWRYEYVRARFVWLPDVWSLENQNFDSLREKIYQISRGSVKMDGLGKIVSLVDENAPTWFTNFSRQFVRAIQLIWFHITKEETLPILSIAGTLFFIFLVGYGLNYLTMENANKSRQFQKNKEPQQTEQKEWHPDDPKTQSTAASSISCSTAKSPTQNFVKNKIWREMEPMIHELRAETYFGLIRLLKPGCRSIVVLVDTDSKEVLLPQFARNIYPLRNNKTFSFGFLMVNKNLAWFKALLEHTLPEEPEGTLPTTLSATSKDRLKDINPKQTLGTVLVLCGWKLYFSMYHPMHTGSNRRKNSKSYVGECDSGEDSSDSISSNVSTSSTSAGLNKSDKKEKITKKDLNIKNVLNGMSLFLDRLLEGSIRRYYIPEWPDNLK